MQRILIVDDEENARRNISKYLISKDYEVHDVATLEEARECINKDSADVILMDIRMPNLDGITAAREIQQICPTPIVLVSAHESPGLLTQAPVWPRRGTRGKPGNGIARKPFFWSRMT